MKPALVLPALAVILACPTGTSVGGFAPAKSPNGIRADIRIAKSKTRIVGELLEVRDSMLLVLRDGARVTAVPIQDIRSASFAKMGVLISDGEFLGDLERLRLVSRYPAGLAAELEAQLLAAYGQTEPDRVTPP